ncbi:MAG: pyridoxal-phosphate dependent enzyme [Deltaproteobacteria bacterium]|nr:pyridoxal-phosphate dependent enzyme [Deltaproteobacteria bacterium]
MVSLRCAGCAELVPLGGAGLAWACPRRDSGDGADHVLVRHLEPTQGWPASAPAWGESPYRRFAGRLFARHLAEAHGLGDAFEAIVSGLEDAIEAVDGRTFRTARPQVEEDLAGIAGMGPGTLQVKDETGNVSGSHKARHLMGVLLTLEVAERAGLARVGQRLAIASCGNAALAAATLAAAAKRPLDVYVPESADPTVVARLGHLGATVHPCARRAGEAGDPSYLRFREAVAGGALPFSCQGPDNGLAVEGGLTLGWELAEALAEAPVDHLFVQVGGGALGSAVAEGLREANLAGRLEKVPKIHLVQTRGAWPLARAYARLSAGALLPGEKAAAPDEGWSDERLTEHAARASALYWAYRAKQPSVHTAIAQARTQRAAFMEAWPTEPRSIAHGILDDETYDWARLLEALLETGGLPLVVGEPLLAEAQLLAREQTSIPADPTGTAGLAGLLQLRRAGILEHDERCLVLFTGIDREVEAARRR